MAVTLTTVQSVKCVVCGRLHERYMGKYILLYGGWSLDYPDDLRFLDRRKSPVSYGTQEAPTVVCDNDKCISKVMKRGEGDD